MFFTDSEEYNSLFRYTLYKYYSDFSLEIINEFPHINYYGKKYETKKYINLIKEDKFLAGNLEIAEIAAYEKIKILRKCFIINLLIIMKINLQKIKLIHL